MDLFFAAAEDFKQRVLRTLEEKNLFSVVLSGGNTPKAFFDVLAKEELPWHRIQFFFGDERYVPADDDASNYHMAFQHLFSKVPVNPDYVYRIPTEFQHPKDAAQQYEQTLHTIFHTEFPPFDLCYLGLGDDAHTASLMPCHEIQGGNLVGWLKMDHRYRITLTAAAINHSQTIIFLVTGMNKSAAVNQVLKGKKDVERYPAQLIQNAIWYLDEAAASQLQIFNVNSG